jgi:hypothetical protein
MTQQELPIVWEKRARPLPSHIPLAIRQAIPQISLKWQQRILIRKALAGEQIPKQVLEPIDYSYRPDSYWSAKDLRQLVANIKGAERKKRALQLIDEGCLEEATDFVLADTLSEEDRDRAGQIHPALMGGEYLPDYHASEIEIARITMDSITQDVISIRARPEKGQIHYRVVDEYESECLIKPKSSSRPLTLRQLVRLIDTGKDGDGPIGLGIIEIHRECTGQPADDFANFMHFSSEFYPDLTKHYWFAEQRWLEKNRNRRAA